MINNWQPRASITVATCSTLKQFAPHKCIKVTVIVELCCSGITVTVEFSSVNDQLIGAITTTRCLPKNIHNAELQSTVDRRVSVLIIKCSGMKVD